MVTCSLKNEKSTLGRSAEMGDNVALTAEGVGFTVGAAVVTTSSPGKSRLWPTALSLAEGVAPMSAGRGVVVDNGMSLGSSQGKCFSSKGRLVFQTAKTK